MKQSGQRNRWNRWGGRNHKTPRVPQKPLFIHIHYYIPARLYIYAHALGTQRVYKNCRPICSICSQTQKSPISSDPDLQKVPFHRHQTSLKRHFIGIGNAAIAEKPYTFARKVIYFLSKTHILFTKKLYTFLPACSLLAT